MTDKITLQRWRKKPVVIEAMRWEPAAFPEVGAVVGWLMANGCDFHHPSDFGGETTLAIRTLNGGAQLAQPGDWVIRDPTGEFRVCRPDVFEAAYEFAGESSHGH